MRLRQVDIKNFRILKDVSFPVSDRTLIIGENDAGKTAIVDALRIALGRGPLGRLSPFEESDYHLEMETDSPEISAGIQITLWFREDFLNQWPEPLKLALADIDQTHPVSGLDTIGLRVSSRYEEGSVEASAKWEFLDLGGNPLTGRGARANWTARFLTYLVFRDLPALRDPSHEFSVRSRTLGRILRQISFSPDARAKIAQAVKDLNDLLVGSDPLFKSLLAEISRLTDVVPLQGSDPISIRAAPTEPWELLARSELAVRGRGSSVQIPLLKHGLGLQSLAVLFLLEAYVDLTLRQEFLPETEALLAIEEPEAHLHPQATMAFARHMSSMKSQVILTTHSPYFLATVPIESAVFLRSSGSISETRCIPRHYTFRFPDSPSLTAMCAGMPDRWKYDQQASSLTLVGAMTSSEYASLKALAATDGPTLSELQRAFEVSQAYLSKDELAKLGEWGVRVRGHAFFARSWLICEGPSDLVVFQGLSELLAKPLEPKGVSLIDCRLHGSVGTFVAVAQNLGIPWVLACDGDDAGLGYVEQARGRAAGELELDKRLRPILPKGTVIEGALLNSNLRPTVVKAAEALGFSDRPETAGATYDARIMEFLRNDKLRFAQEFCRQLKDAGHQAADVPAHFSETIDLAISLAG